MYFFFVQSGIGLTDNKKLPVVISLNNLLPLKPIHCAPIKVSQTACTQHTGPIVRAAFTSFQRPYGEEIRSTFFYKFSFSKYKQTLPKYRDV